MQSVVTTAVKTKKTYANDGSFESVEGMLIQQASIFYGRVLGLGLPMEFEDVLQEVNMAYVKARKKWSPEKAKFNTYCFVVVRNEFNRRIERMVNDRVHLGMGSIDNLASGEDDGEVGDGYSRYLNEESTDLAPDERIERRQEVMQRLRRLTPHSRAVVAKLVAGEQNQQLDVQNLREIATSLGLTPPQMRAVEQEIHNTFGVEVRLSNHRKKVA